MTQGRKISKKRMVKRMITKFTDAVILLIGLVSFGITAALCHLASLRIEYAEAICNRDTVYANNLFLERQAIGAGDGIMAFLYNLPIALKIVLLIVSAAVAVSIVLLYVDYRAKKKRAHHARRVARRSW